MTFLQLTRRTFGVLTLAACTHQPAPRPNIIGVWAGQWRKADSAIDVVMRFEQSEAGYTGEFDSGDLRVVGIPFARVAVSGNDVRFEVAGNDTTTAFDGVLSNETLEGVLREGEAAGTFSFRRAINPSPRPAATQVTFDNGGLTLAGEVVTAGSTPASRPGIVFLHGSQAEGRWASRYLAHRFAERGFAALIFDKRGVGQSSGDWQSADFNDLAGDGVAAFAALAAHDGVDRNRIGIFGHSQGGGIAPLVAQRTPAKFVIGSAAPGLSPAEIEIYSVGNAIGAPALTGAERADAEDYVREIVAVGYEGHPYAVLEHKARTYADRGWFFAPPTADDYYWAFARRIASFDPAVEWSRVGAPVLLLYGAQDERVPPTISADALARALRQAGVPVSVRIYDGADHAFRLAPQEGGWPRTAPGYVEDMLDWAAAIARSV